MAHSSSRGTIRAVSIPIDRAPQFVRASSIHRRRRNQKFTETNLVAPSVLDHRASITVNETWSALGEYVKRHRGALLGGIGSAAVVALTLEPTTPGMRFAMWFAVSAT